MSESLKALAKDINEKLVRGDKLAIAKELSMSIHTVRAVFSDRSINPIGIDTTMKVIYAAQDIIKARQKEIDKLNNSIEKG